MLSTHSIRESAAWYMADVLPDMVDHFGQLPDIEQTTKLQTTQETKKTQKTQKHKHKSTQTKQHYLEDNSKKQMCRVEVSVVCPHTFVPVMLVRTCRNDT